MPEFLLLGEPFLSSDNADALNLLTGESWPRPFLVAKPVPALLRPYRDPLLCLTDIALRKVWPNDRPMVADPVAARDVRGLEPCASKF